MGKRFISANASEILAMDGAALKQSIQASEGRVIVTETVAAREPRVKDISNAEIAHAFGADLILLNGLDVFSPVVHGIDGGDDGREAIRELHRLVGSPIGVNLEPVDDNAVMTSTKKVIPRGRRLSRESAKAIEELGMDFVCLTGNPGSGVTNDSIARGITLVKEEFSGMVIAGKMHAAGVNEPVCDAEAVVAFLDAGADVILAPAVGTVPGFRDEELVEIVRAAHERGALVMSAIGTSQEGSDVSTIREIALRNKICGVDMQHIGDSGYAGLAPVENIYALSVALRGTHHTVSRMARSINR